MLEIIQNTTREDNVKLTDLILMKDIKKMRLGELTIVAKKSFKVYDIIIRDDRNRTLARCIYNVESYNNYIIPELINMINKNIKGE